MAITTTREQALAVADWRRRVHRLYAEVRATRSPAEGHALWVAGREELFTTHPASPRRAGQSLRHADHDPAFRFELALDPAPAQEWTYSTGSDGDGSTSSAWDGSRSPRCCAPSRRAPRCLSARGSCKASEPPC